MNPSVLVHGGAGGWDRDPARLRIALEACRRAVDAGLGAMSARGTALDAVEAAVRLLEDEPALNAGRGSFPNTDGVIEMDALIMDGAALGLGAVAAVQRVLHPISLARRVMTDTTHTLLAGEGASRFADSIGFPRCSNADLVVPRDLPPPARDTVGAVAIDGGGNLAAATSTGGIPRKLPGRVGDSPLPGAGAYADNATAAAGATGDGEALMKVVISKQVCDYVAAGMDAQAACAAAIDLLARRTGGSGGLIAIDTAGRPGVAFNSAGMPYGWGVDGRAIVVDHVMRRLDGQAE